LFDGVFDNGSGITMAPGGIITRTNGSIVASPDVTGVYNVVYNNSSPINSGPELPSEPDRLNDLTVAGATDVALTDDFTINGDLMLSSGNLEAGVSTVTLEGDIIGNSSGNFTSSTLVFNGTSNFSGSSIPELGNVVIEDGATVN